MQIPFIQFICSRILKHPKIRAVSLNPKEIAQIFGCTCEVCGQYFLLDEKGLRKLIETHDPEQRRPKPPTPPNTSNPYYPF